MNYINCKNALPPEDIRKTIIFWCENSTEHINSLLSAFKGSGAVLQEEFINELKELEAAFSGIYNEYKSEKRFLPAQPAVLFKTNTRFIKLLERIKLEAASGYPLLQQTVYHYIFEQNYVNAIFGVTSAQNELLITVKFSPFYNNNCIYNQLYFWSVIASMHPSLLLNSEDFKNAINGYSLEYLRDTANAFNEICYCLTALKKRTNKKELSEIFRKFRQLNLDFLAFLDAAVKGSMRVYSSTSSPRLSTAFYKRAQHIINEHKLVSELCDSLAESL